MANLNDALQRNNPVLDKNAYCQVITAAWLALKNDSYPDQGAGPTTTIVAPLSPQGLYCVISNQMNQEIEVITMDSISGLPGGTDVHADRVGIPIGGDANLMLAMGSQTTAYIKTTAGAAGNVVLTWFQ
jgi:hypothetical protein